MATCVDTRYTTSLGSGCSGNPGPPSYARPINRLISSDYVAQQPARRRAVWPQPKATVSSASTSTFEGSSVQSNVSTCTERSGASTSIPDSQRRSWPKRTVSSMKRKIINSNLATSLQSSISQSNVSSQQHAGVTSASKTLEKLRARIESSIGPSRLVSKVFDTLAEWSRETENRKAQGIEDTHNPLAEFAGNEELLIQQIALWKSFQKSADTRILAEGDDLCDEVPTETGGDFIKEKRQSSDYPDSEYTMSGGLLDEGEYCRRM